jgi:hypothetical protein
MKNALHFISGTFEDFFETFSEFNQSVLEHAREDFYRLFGNDDSSEKLIELSIDQFDLINSTYNKLIQRRDRLISIDRELMKNMKISQNLIFFGDNSFIQYKRFLEREEYRLKDEKQMIISNPISILYLPYENKTEIYTTKSAEITKEIFWVIKTYLAEVEDDKIIKYDHFFKNNSIFLLEDFGVSVEEIIQEINDEKQLELEDNILNNYWYLEYSVHFPVNDKNTLKKLLKDDELDFNDFEIIKDHSLIKWYRTIDNDEDFTGHDFHPLMNDFDKKIKSKIKKVVIEEIKDCIVENGDRVLEEILELSNYTYSIEISLCELDDSEYLTEKSLIF